MADDGAAAQAAQAAQAEGGTPARAGRQTVVVVGGGIAGLAAAWELTGGANGPGPETPDVIVVEADHRLGGKLRTEQFCGQMVDVGPDGFLGRRPEATALCRELGLGPEMEPIGAAGAAVWARGRRRPMPGGLFLGVPTKFLPVARSGILSPLGTARLLFDLLAPRPDRRGPLGDRAIGPLVTRKLGRQAVARLVEPLLGGIYAGGVADASAAAVFPPLLKVSQGRASFMRSMGSLARSEPAAPGPQIPSDDASPSETVREANGETGIDSESQAEADVETAILHKAQRKAFPRKRIDGAFPLAVPRRRSDRHQPTTGGESKTAPDEAGGSDVPPKSEPAFWALRNGLESLVDRLASALRGRGVDIRPGCAATALTPAGDKWCVEAAGGPIEADGVVLALPAQPAADLLRPLDADAAAMLETVTYAAVGVVTLAYPVGALPDDLYGTGLLVPRDTLLPLPSVHVLGAPANERCMVTACTFLSTKWPHLAAPGHVLVRASVGRFGDERFAALDDDALVDRVAGELAGLLGATELPSAAMVTRWSEALPQYRVHHLLRVGGVESAARRLGSLAVAGAAYHGVGIPACIGSGRAAARSVLGRLRGDSSAAMRSESSVPGDEPGPAGTETSPAGTEASPAGAEQPAAR